ncbi:hypothetical protein [Halorussus sp. AFM4]|uniref:hypothetical protein n=1 Tax=Halorussus sp. AFM4 TaxID=3421651 RepID=UPI003EC14AC2
MDGRNRSKSATLPGVVAAAVGAVGYLAFGWRFGGDSNPVALAAAPVCAAAAVGFTLRGE